MGDRLKGISLYLCEEKYGYWDKIFNRDQWVTQEWDVLDAAKLPPNINCDKNSDKNFTRFVFKTKFQKKYFPNEWNYIFEKEVNYWNEFYFDQNYFYIFDGKSY
jgi:hypothetical protein